MEGARAAANRFRVDEKGTSQLNECSYDLNASVETSCLTLLMLSTFSHGFERLMLCLWNSAHGVCALQVVCWPHATDTKHVQKIKTTMLDRFMTDLPKAYWSMEIGFQKFGSFASEGNCVSASENCSSERRGD
jgi:hypothetical protein